MSSGVIEGPTRPRTPETLTIRSSGRRTGMADTGTELRLADSVRSAGRASESRGIPGMGSTRSPRWARLDPGSGRPVELNRLDSGTPGLLRSVFQTPPADALHVRD